VKHYFAGAQRAASRLSGTVYQPPGVTGLSPSCPDLQARQVADLERHIGRKVSHRAHRPLPDTLRRTGGSLFFFHPDHLGSGTLLTDANGNAYQFFVNLPFGETLAEQRASGAYNNVYKFTGKELDSETGLYYLGARYYSPVDGIFLSVDPLAGSFPSWGPYVYALNNPVRLTDPTGMAPEDPIKKLLSRAKNYAISRARAEIEKRVVSATRATASYIHEKLSNVKTEIKAEGRLLLGWAAGGEVAKGVESVRNYGSIEVAKVKVGVELSANGVRNTSEISTVVGDIKEGNLKYRQSLSASVDVRYIGGGMEVEREGVLNIDDFSTKESTVESDAGMSVYGLGAAFGGGKENSAESGSKKFKKLTVGTGVERGFLLMGKADAEIETKFYKKQEDD
jgi:RHS repeat-associated protein